MGSPSHAATTEIGIELGSVVEKLKTRLTIQLLNNWHKIGTRFKIQIRAAILWMDPALDGIED